MANEIEKGKSLSNALSEFWKETGWRLNWPGWPGWTEWANVGKWDFMLVSDVKETDEGTEITAEIPGVGKEDIEVLVKDNVLTISGEKKSQTEKNEENYKISEISYGSFKRSYTLSDNSDAEKIEANFSKDKDGVLKVWVPKKQNVLSKEEVKKIEVK